MNRLSKVMRIDAASEQGGGSFKLLAEKMLCAAKICNHFLHECCSWEVSHEFATECLGSIPNLVALFRSKIPSPKCIDLLELNFRAQSGDLQHFSQMAESSLVATIREIGCEMVSCQEGCDGASSAVSHTPPRCLYLEEVTSCERGVIVVGLNPGKASQAELDFYKCEGRSYAATTAYLTGGDRCPTPDWCLGQCLRHSYWQYRSWPHLPAESIHRVGHQHEEGALAWRRSGLKAAP